MDLRTCANCGEEFLPNETARGKYCSRQCAQANFRGRKKETPRLEAPEGALETFMSQPEVQHLRAGIQVALRTAFKRVFNG